MGVTEINTVIEEVEKLEKYELSNIRIRIGDTVLYRIKAISSFGDVAEGDYGGFIEKIENLSDAGECWIYDNSWVFGDATVSENAKIKGFVKVFGNATVSGNVVAYGHVEISGNATVSGNAKLSGNVIITDHASVSGNSKIYGNARLYEYTKAYDNSNVHGNAWLYGNSEIYEYGTVYGNVQMFGEAWVHGHSTVYENIRLYGKVSVFGTTELFGNGWYGTDERITIDNRNYNNTQFVSNQRLNTSLLEYIDGRFKYQNP